MSGKAAAVASGVSFNQAFLPYAHSAIRYLEAGWSPLPLYPGAKIAKGVPPKGFTGRAGRMATIEDVNGWVETDGGRAIGLRLPPGVVGIDVDAYDPKHGGETLGKLIRHHDILPVTWVSSARDDLLSGIRFYRIPEELVIVPAQLGTDIDLIHFGYRFARVWPSSHPSGMMYKWVNPQGRIDDENIPVVGDLPLLPDAWIPLLSQGAAGKDENDDEWRSSESYLKPDIQKLRTEGLPLDCNHDSTLSQVVWDLCRFGSTDSEAASVWIDIVNHTQLKNSQWPFTRADFSRHLDGARRKLAGTAIQPDQRAWAENQQRYPTNGSATEVLEKPQVTSDATEMASEADAILALVNTMFIRNDDGDINLPATHSNLPFSDMASADFIIAHHDGIFNFSTNSQLWRIWDGTVYVKAEDGNIEHIVQQYARAYRLAMDQIKLRALAQFQFTEGLTEAEAVERYRTVWRNHRDYEKSIWNNPAQGRILRQLRDQLSVSEEKFDGELSEAFIVASNGVVDVGGGDQVLLSHDPEKLITKRLSARVIWDPAAEAPVFHRFIETSIRYEEQREWLQIVFGLALAGKPVKGFINLIGFTNSGKSTFIRAVQRVLGSYAATVPVETLLESAIPTTFSLHELKGCRVAFANEPAAGRKLDSEVIKSVTGGDEMRTREPYGKFVTWRPKCVIVLASNQPQRFETSDTAMLNRICPVEFTAAHEMDTSLDRKLSQETAGILKWLVEGAVKGIRLGAPPELPESMLILREKMAERVDEVLTWLREALSEGQLTELHDIPASSFVKTSEAYFLYTVWCAQNGVKPVGSKTFSRRVSRLYPVVRSNSSRFSWLRKN